MLEKCKKALCVLLILLLTVGMMPVLTMPTEAATPDYTVTSSYKASAYYSALCNVVLTGDQRTDIVNIALSQVGYREGSSSGDYGGADDGSYNNYTEYNYWYHNYVNSGMPVGGDGAPWCATFVSWCAEQANIPSSILKRSTAAGHGANYFNVNFYSGSSTLASSGDNDSYFKGYNYTPQKGDLFFTRSWSHVGLVVGVSGSYVITVEGNTNNNGSSQGNGVYKLTWRTIADLYFGVPNYTNISVKHTVDSSYGTNFTAYPKSEITAENILDAYHSQIDSTSWIGTSDKCTIHEVYTDGCCKVTYPLDAGGTKTVYSKISLFNVNAHTHSYTGARYYESAHPHAITQRCVDYDTCGGWTYTGEYYEKNTCEQCWHADFNIGASSVSIKVGESKTVAVSVGGCLPDSAVAYPSFSPDNDVAEVTIKNQQATFTGLKEGTTLFQIRIYSDSSKSILIGATSIRIDVAVPTYTVSYNANGGTGAPSSQTKSHGTALTLSTVIPSRFGYTFLGWATSSGATSATYQPGSSFTDNANTTLYAVWKAATTISSGVTNSSYDVLVPFSDGYQYFTITPSTTGKYRFESTGSLDSRIYVYDANGNQLTSNDDGGENRNFLLDYQLTAGTKYYILTDLYTGTGSYSFTVKRVYTVTYNANNGSGAPSAQEKLHGTSLTLSTSTPTRSGYTFLGWATSSGATSATYQPGGSFTANADTTLYAVWQRNASQTDAQIVVSNGTASPGGTVTVTIAVKNNPGIASMKLVVTYGDILTLTNISYNTAIGGQFQQPQTMNSPVILNWFNGAADSTGDWVFATLTFQVSDAAQGGDVADITVRYDANDVYNIADQNVTFGLVNGQVTVASHTPGDITGDGAVNNRDLTRLFQYLSGWDVEIH